MKLGSFQASQVQNGQEDFEVESTEIWFISFNNFLYKRCGTPGFVAPEIISHGKDMDYDQKVDIFSAGVIFYIL